MHFPAIALRMISAILRRPQANQHSDGIRLLFIHQLKGWRAWGGFLYSSSHMPEWVVAAAGFCKHDLGPGLLQ